jgi:glycosyl transferase family 25
MIHTFVINLDTPHGRARWPKVQGACEAAGLQCERVPGVNGATLRPDEVERATTGMCRRMCTPAMVGCAMSHRKCWGLVVERGLPWALILEDDVTFVDTFSEAVRHVVDSAPAGWHVIALGCHVCGPRVQRVLGGDHFDNGTVRSVRLFGGAHAYLVSHDGARHLLQHAAKVKYHVDYQMSMLTPGLHVYAVHKDLAFQGQENDTSTMISTAFPRSINKVISGIKNEEGISLEYYANAPLARVGPYTNSLVITPFVLVMLALGLFRASWKLVIGLAVVDMALFPPSSFRGPAALLGAYGLGYGLRSLTRPGFARRWRG